MDNMYECQVPEISSAVDEEEEREERECYEFSDSLRQYDETLQAEFRQVQAIIDEKRELEEKLQEETRLLATCDQLIAAENEEGQSAYQDMLQTHAEVCEWEEHLASKTTDLEQIRQNNSSNKDRNDHILALVDEERWVRLELAKYNVYVID